MGSRAQFAGFPDVNKADELHRHRVKFPIIPTKLVGILIGGPMTMSNRI
jgi:hypothetical protein